MCMYLSISVEATPDLHKFHLFMNNKYLVRCMFHVPAPRVVPRHMSVMRIPTKKTSLSDPKKPLIPLSTLPVIPIQTRHLCVLTLAKT